MPRGHGVLLRRQPAARARSSRCIDQVTGKTRVGIILDVRNPDFAARFPEILARLRRRVPGTRLLFLDASEESLIRRFSETRRPHPLAGRKSRCSRRCAASARCSRRSAAVADVVVDTSAMTVHELRSFMQKTFVGDPESGRDGHLGDVVRVQVRDARTTWTCSSTCAFWPTRTSCRSSRARPGWTRPSRRTSRRTRRRGPFLDRLVGFLDYLAAAVRAGGQELPLDRHRLHRRQAPLRLHRRAARRTAQGAGVPGPRLPPRRHPRMR